MSNLLLCHLNVINLLNVVAMLYGLKFCNQTCDSLPACRLALVLAGYTGILFPQFGVTWYVYF